MIEEIEEKYFVIWDERRVQFPYLWHTHAVNWDDAVKANEHAIYLENLGDHIRNVYITKTIKKEDDSNENEI